MPRLNSFINVSLDGYYADRNGDMSFAHKHDPEAAEFMAENARGGGMLVFGRLTYELMQQYWPTPFARENDPVVAERMNQMPKLVFSRTLASATWSNTLLVNRDPAKEIRRLKAEGRETMTILGSGTLVRELAEQNLIDEYDLMINPILLGEGKRLFAGLKKAPELELVSSRTFKNGNVFVRYRAKTAD
jgi:dihydrofolate reductase